MGAAGKLSNRLDAHPTGQRDSVYRNTDIVDEHSIAPIPLRYNHGGATIGILLELG